MPRRRTPPYFARSTHRRALSRPSIATILEESSLADLRRRPKRLADIIAFFAARHAAIATARASVQPAINATLSAATKPIHIAKWQRRVKVKYQDNPLSAAGSYQHGIGGRFNLGKIDPGRLAPFPGLYLASDPKTAHLEIFGEPQGVTPGILEDRVFGDRSSYGIYSVSGEIADCLDVTDFSVLSGFVDIIKSFSTPPEIENWSQRLGLEKLEIIRDLKTLQEALFRPNWRRFPSYLNNPAEGQVFGSIVAAAGIEAIKYPSVRNPGGFCMVIYPANLKHSKSWIALDDPVPPGVITRLDHSTYTALM